jgi:hypothetical protein
VLVWRRRVVVVVAGSSLATTMRARSGRLRRSRVALRNRGTTGGYWWVQQRQLSSSSSPSPCAPLLLPTATEPPDAAQRRSAPAVVVYAIDNLPSRDDALYARARKDMTKVAEVVVPPRDGRAFDVPAGHLFRVRCTEGPQVGDLNLWNADNLAERFYTSKTRQLHATHLTTGCECARHAFRGVTGSGPLFLLV